MGAHSRRKGRNGELEVQKRLTAIGGDAVLNYGQPEEGGAQGDVLSLFGNFEIKRRAAFPAWLNLAENVRGVYCRRDRGEWMVVLRARDAETLINVKRMFDAGEITSQPQRYRDFTGEKVPSPPMAGVAVEAK